MKKKLSFEYELHDDSSTTGYSELIESAIAAKNSAYAPFSSFQVGAAALMNDGEIAAAANQESEVFPSGICAERALLYSLQNRMAGRVVEAIAVTSFPCGACRQVMVDTESRNGKNIKVFVVNTEGIVHQFDRVADLLPFMFIL